MTWSARLFSTWSSGSLALLLSLSAGCSSGDRPLGLGDLDGGGHGGSGGSGGGVGGNGGSGGSGGGGGMGGSGGSGGGGGIGGGGGMGGGGDMASGGMLDGGGGGNDMGIGGDVIDKLLALTANCTAANMVSQHTYPDPGSAVTNVPICALKGAVFFNSDMDVDCDGRPTAGKCPTDDPSYQADTAFHNMNNLPLEAAVTPYVVIPNDFMYQGLDTMNGGNVVAVIYNHKLEFAVFGDTGPTNLIGEASYACAAGLGINPDPGMGGVNKGVTYIVFVGMNTAPSDIENQSETKQLGDQLVKALLLNN